MTLVGVNEAILIGAVVLALVMGPKKLPELARAVGKSKTEYKKSVHEAQEELEDLNAEPEE